MEAYGHGNLESPVSLVLFEVMPVLSQFENRTVSTDVRTILWKIGTRVQDHGTISNTICK